MNTRITLIIAALLILGAVAESKAQNVLVLGQSNARGLVRDSKTGDRYFLEAIDSSHVDSHLIGGAYNKAADEILKGNKIDKIVLIQGEGDGVFHSGWAAKWAGIITYYKVQYCNKKCKIYTNVNAKYGIPAEWPLAKEIRDEQMKLHKIIKSRLIDMSNYMQSGDRIHLLAKENERLAAFVHNK